MTTADAVQLVLMLKRKGFSYKQIAKIAGVGEKTVWRWVNTDGKPHKKAEKLIRFRILKVFRDVMRNGKPKGQKTL